VARVCSYDESGLWQVEFEKRSEHLALERLGIPFRRRIKGERNTIYVVRTYQGKLLTSTAKAEHVQRLVREEIARLTEKKLSERARIAKARKERKAFKDSN